MNNRESLTWQDDSVCAQTDPEAYFQEGSGSYAKKVVDICFNCDVQLACLTYALSVDKSEDHGLWGGLGAKQRELLRTKLINGKGISASEVATNAIAAHRAGKLQEYINS